jgi:hypothetical protein
LGELLCNGRLCRTLEDRRVLAGEWKVGVSLRGSGEDSRLSPMIIVVALRIESYLLMFWIFLVTGRRVDGRLIDDMLNFAQDMKSS